MSERERVEHIYEAEREHIYSYLLCFGVPAQELAQDSFASEERVRFESKDQKPDAAPAFGRPSSVPYRDMRPLCLAKRTELGRPGRKKAGDR